MRLRHMHVHLITVEVGVVGRGDRQVEAESGVGQDAHAVAHHTHFVQRGLTVEEHQVSVMQVALHLVSKLQPLVLPSLHELQVDAAPILTDDELCACFAWGRVGTIVHQRLQLVDVEGRGSFRERQVQRDGPRYAQLINADVGVARDDCARRKVDALAHEVAPDAAFFALEALRDGLDGAAALLHAWGHAGDGVIHVCGDVVLHELRKVVDDVLGCPILLLLAQRVVGANDLRQFVRQVILTPC
mmetsp:Transcript_14393/g.39001  ORF Transcript_14393/g.39001 Transcript_14393/m.39001 type:complete len:244 (-) Transcript_14393:836-1567(-)